MRLHENNNLFTQSIEVTSTKMNISKQAVEKDYWVTFLLKNIYLDPIGKEVIFKGGTALVKCFHLIKRFSEDIDLMIIRKEGETGNQSTKKIRKVSKIASDLLPEIYVENITRKRGMNRKTAHTYNKEFNEGSSQILDIIVVEATWFGNYEPYSTKSVNSFIYSMMKDVGQDDLAEEYELLPFDVLAMEPQRTICEKIMSLVRFSYSDDAILNLGKKIRHTYDLHQMLKDKRLSDFFNSSDFDEMMQKVGNDDVKSFKNNNQWLKFHPSKALIFADSENVWSELKSIYKADFSRLVFGDLPDGKDILKTILMIKNRLADISWDVNILN